MKNIKIMTQSGLPSLVDLQLRARTDAVILYDQKLLKNRFIKVWLSKFPNKIALNAGESLKTINAFSGVLKKMSQIPIHKQTTIVALGGGSVGDFVGFLASTYKRGLRLVHVPSTWLAAIDSAHGGKNGLNFFDVKNQIGTFYWPDTVIVSKKVLMSQPSERLTDAFGEVFKMGLISQPQLFKSPRIDAKFLWKNLNQLIAGKYKIVEQDPFEKTGLRQVLNLGHTMGHVFESVHKISHGQAVLLGLMFAARYSFQLGYLHKNEFVKICQVLFSVPLKIQFNKILKIPEKKLKSILLQDKKRITHAANAEINFIFIHKIGNVFVQPVQINDLLKEVRRQRKQL
jgi:3-dehydroquinate synthase